MQDFIFHGGRLDLAELAFPDAPRPWLDLSTGINPDPWRPATPMVPDLTRLPSPDALRALEAAAAAAFRTIAPVAALPGSEVMLRLLGTLGLPGPVRYVLPAYRSHRLKAARAIPVATLEREARAGGTIILANPNNPDGRLLAPERLLAVARALARRGGLLVVDEAFADAVAGSSVLPLLRDEPVLVLRSFGKVFGLPGVRLGFACGAWAEWIGASLGSWPVSATAIAWGAAAYADGEWIAAAPGRLAARAAALDAVLREARLEPVGACPLFRLVRTEQAGALFERLAAWGILTRPFEDAPCWLRIGLPNESGLERLRAGLRG